MMVTKLSKKKVKNCESIAKALIRLRDETYTTPYKVAKATGAPIQILYRYINGTKSIIESHILQ